MCWNNDAFPPNRTLQSSQKREFKRWKANIFPHFPLFKKWVKKWILAKTTSSWGFCFVHGYLAFSWAKNKSFRH
jgi:hypothetical protein